MRLGLEPVAQPYPFSGTPTSGASVFQPPAGNLLLNQNGSGGATLQMSSTSSDEDAGAGDSSFDKSSTNAVETDAENRNGNDEPDNRDRREGSVSATGGSAGESATANNTVAEETNTTNATCGASVTSSSPNDNGKVMPNIITVLLCC